MIMKWYLFKNMAQFTTVAGNVDFLHQCVGVPQVENGVLYGTYKNPYTGLRYESKHPYSTPIKCFYAYLTNKKVSQCALYGGSQEYSDNYIWNKVIGVIDDTSLPSVYTANSQSSIISGANIQGKREWKPARTSVNDQYKSCYIPISFEIGNQQYIGMYFQPMIHNGTGYQNTSSPSYYDQIWFYKADGTYTVGYSGGSYQLADKQVDFGTLQEIPEYFYNWIMSNSDEAKTAKIIIKEGDTILAESPMIPPYTSISLATVGNVTTLTTNTGGYITFDTKDNFSGLSKSELAIIPTILNGKTNLYASNTIENFWLCYKKGKEQPNSFLCSFYCCSAEENRVDKTNYLSDKKDFYITLKGEANILGFSILLEIKDLPEIWTIPKWNYCYVPNFDRYYFANLISVYNNVWEFELKVDALMSFKNEISKLYGMVDRNEKEFDRDIPDDLIVTKAYPTIDINEISGTSDLFRYDSDAAGEYNYLVILRG